MKINKVNSLKVADRVLADLKRSIAKWPEHRYGPLALRVWSNCREQGYYLMIETKAVVFAECRNTPQIVVIAGSVTEFDVTTNMPSDERFEDAKYFVTVESAAKYIANIISEDVAKSKR